MKAATKDTLDQWAGKSVWSLVCAMELGLISDTASRNNNEVSFRPISEIASKSPLRISPRLRTTPRFRKKRGGGRRRRRASKSGKMSGKRREMYANDSTITVDQFWKSCKRKPGRPKKRSADLLSSSIDRRPILADESCRSTRSRSANNNNNNNVLLANGTDAPRAFEPRRVSRDDNGAWKSSTKTVLHEKTNDENTIENVVTRSKREKGFESKDSKRDENRESTTRFDEIHTLPLMKRIFRESGAVYGIENEREDGRDTDVEKSTVYEAGKKDSVKKVSSYERKKVRAKMLKGNEENQEVRRVTRGSMKIGKDLSVGKLVWGYCAGWWPALIVDADHVGMLSEEGKLWVYWIGEARISLLNEKTQIEPFSCNLKARLTQNLNVPRIRAIDATMQMLRKKLGSTLTKPYFTWIESNFPKNMIEMLDEIKFYPYPVKMQQRLDHLKEKNAKVTERYLLDQKRENQEKKLAEKSKDSPQKVNVDLTLLPLKEQNPGIIAWAKIAGHNWWPAMIIDYRDCCMREPTFGCQWIMWYGDYKLSEVHHQLFLRFDKGMEKMREYINNTKKHIYLVGVLQASKVISFISLL
ncbi:uncharacterized protein LOC100865871 [Apis florea]|uniref:uncharacterized protein LOC100865871 n=1 Tax=Apis florea TaxID=7463 RepID=UPI0012FE900F|nr:uncharacterized protein LOC100865871 [Apis florea]